jgi:hypothetical protein
MVTCTTWPPIMRTTRPPSLRCWCSLPALVYTGACIHGWCAGGGNMDSAQVLSSNHAAAMMLLLNAGAYSSACEAAGA